MTLTATGRAAGRTELADSRHLLGDAEALRRRVRDDGYVFLRGLLDPVRVTDIGRRGLTALQDGGWTDAGHNPVSAPPRLPVRAVAMRDAFGDGAYRRILADPGFNALAYDSPLAVLMHQLLGPEGFCYPLKIPRLVYPASVVPRQPGNVVHKDFGAVQDMFTCWVPLGRVPVTLGGLALKEGSQHSGRVLHRPLKRLERGWRTTDYEPGDVLVFHCLTTHAALPNHEHRMRFSAEYRWQRADQPAPRRLVLGSGGNELWSRLFGRSDWWHPVPTGLRLFEDGGDDPARHRARHRAAPVPPSRFVDLR